VVRSSWRSGANLAIVMAMAGIRSTRMTRISLDRPTIHLGCSRREDRPLHRKWHCDQCVREREDKIDSSGTVARPVMHRHDKNSRPALGGGLCVGGAVRRCSGISGSGKGTTSSCGTSASDYQFTQNQMAYMTIATGRQSGRIQCLHSGRSAPLAVCSGKHDAYEAG